MRTLDGQYTGWAPRAVRVRAMGQRVRAYLHWHAQNFGAVEDRLSFTHVVGSYIMEVAGDRVPAGWRAGRAWDYEDAFEVGPRWWFRLLELRWHVLHLAARYSALGLDKEGGDFSAGRWWPTCWRPSDEDVERETGVRPKFVTYLDVFRRLGMVQ